MSASALRDVAALPPGPFAGGLQALRVVRAEAPAVLAAPGAAVLAAGQGLVDLGPEPWLGRRGLSKLGAVCSQHEPPILYSRVFL